MKTTNLKAIKNGEEFTWGEVVKIHEIGIYSIVEYESQFHKKTYFILTQAKEICFMVVIRWKRQLLPQLL